MAELSLVLSSEILKIIDPQIAAGHLPKRQRDFDQHWLLVNDSLQKSLFIFDEGNYVSCAFNFGN